MKPKRVLVNAAVLAFHTAEIEQIHALCERAGVPEVIGGVTLSIAQRVAILEGAYRGLIVKFTTRPEIPFH